MKDLSSQLFFVVNSGLITVTIVVHRSLCLCEQVVAVSLTVIPDVKVYMCGER